MNNSLLSVTRLPLEDYYIQMLLEGNVVVYNDLEMSSLSGISERIRIQVYKRRLRTKDRNGKDVVQEYNKIHYNYMDAVHDFLSLRN